MAAKEIPSVVIPVQSQTPTPSNNQQQAQIHQPPIPTFSSPPFKPRITVSPTAKNSSEYHPQYNWQVSRKRPIRTQQISSHKNKFIKLTNIEDLVPDAIGKIRSECLKLQKPREENMNKENPRYFNTFLYFLKPNYIKF